VLVESLRRKRCEALLRKGYARVREREFDSALEIAAQLESQRFSRAFEIAALAQAGKGDLDAAVAALQRGVEVAPDVWLNWQLLGNYLSDLGRYEDAEGAYNRALACPGSSTDSVRLNLAILANRRDRPAVALEFLDELHDPKVVARAREARISSFRRDPTSAAPSGSCASSTPAGLLQHGASRSWCTAPSRSGARSGRRWLASTARTPSRRRALTRASSSSAMSSESWNRKPLQTSRSTT